jgi:HEAT repeats
MRTPTLLAAQILSIAFISFSVVALSAPSDTRNTQPSIQITLTEQKDSAIRLEARQAPLGKILKEIAAKTGAVIHYSVLPEAPVTATCVGANVGQIMDCLVAKQVGLIAHTTQKDKPAEFWLLGSSVGSCQAVTIEPRETAIANQGHKAFVTTPTQASQQEITQTERLLKQANSTDPNQRAEAIYNLGSSGLKNDQSVDDALKTAMDDKDENVRAQAITSLIQRGGEEVGMHFSQALKDQDVNVRFTAVSAIEDDATLLEQALNDSDKGVRDLAKTKLDSLNTRLDKQK